jgi:GR25 family glycosyltransferase involved in LPS biosynthesis
MRIGITAFFRGSSFSGSLPQVAVYLSRALTAMGHEVEFVIPQDSDDWFIDCAEAAICKRVKVEKGVSLVTYNLLLEVVWHLPPDFRTKIAEKTAMFFHYPPVFYDIESSVYPMASLNRDFTSVNAIWTWSHFKKTDISYLELLSKKPVFTIPFLWDPIFSDLYLKSSGVDCLADGEKEIVICESNESNTSSCTIPMTILSEIYKRRPVKWTVLNSDKLITRPFFVANIIKNLHVQQTDISGNFCKRVRLPDLLRKPCVIISHQRWRPNKYMLLDALYLGIPLIHNCAILKDISGGIYYELNRIGQAINAWDKITSGEFISGDLSSRRKLLLSRFSNITTELAAAISSTTTNVILEKAEIQLAFMDMWVDFQPNHNMIVSALRHRNIKFELNSVTPNLIIFGPFGEDNMREKWRHVKKIFYTGESLNPLLRDDIVLNIGFRRNLTFSYFRFPIWMTELNWFDEDPNSFKNPVPFSLELLKTGRGASERNKFCAFVVSNPNSVERNTIYNILSRYKTVDSAGRLFNNKEHIKSGPGGSGGQKDKVEFYKEYKFVLACENSRSNGYLTEKLLHAKLAGCVPIYWGDPYVELDFNPGSFVNVSDFKTADELLDRIKFLDTNNEEWIKIANAPLLNNIDKFKMKLHLLADSIKACVNTDKTDSCNKPDTTNVLIENRDSQNKLILNDTPLVKNKTDNIISTPLKSLETKKINTGPYHIDPINNVENYIVVSCCDHNYVPCAIKMAFSSKYPVYVWGIDLSSEDETLLIKAGAIPKRFDTSWPGFENWGDFWNIEYYAWKPLVLWICCQTFNKGTNILYLDSGIEITNSLDPIWSIINEKGFFVSEMPEHKMRTWSHPTFCVSLNLTEDELNMPQYSANIVGFKVGPYDSMIESCLRLASKKDILAGKKWQKYSDECFGHRHDQSILTLLGFRNGIKPYYLYDFVGEKSFMHSQRSGAVFYVHRGLWKPIVPVAENIDEVFVINLEHREDRLAKFYINNPVMKDNVYRVNAVYGNKLELTKNLVRLFKNNDFNWKKGVIGCALSHYNIWKELAGNKHSKNYLVLEDDVVLDQQFLIKWRKFAHLLPSDSDIVFLGGVLPPNKAYLADLTEPVNSAFARNKQVKIGDVIRRYFHFCTYSYIITRAGANKLCKFIEENGIFTSIDHMLVNHGDSLLNIYFTYPLLAKCFQDDDPAYINADFNNFNRVDKFDSEIWNNVECFTKEEIELAGADDTTIKFVYFEEKQKRCIEQDWLEEIFGKKIEWEYYTNCVLDSKFTVVIYYQHTTPVSTIEGWINRNCGPKFVLFHASDETCTSDVSIYRHPLIKTVFRNYWRPDCISEKVIHLPLGYLNGRGASSHSKQSNTIHNRMYVWSFAGAMDRKGRKEQLERLSLAEPNNKLHMTETWNSPNNLGRCEYVSIIRESKFVPCLAGFFNVESYRFYETLENGAIPITPLDEKNSYTNILGGSMNPPTLALTDMNMLGRVLPMLNSKIDLLESIHRDMQNWWYGYKLYLKRLIASRIVNTRE